MFNPQTCSWESFAKHCIWGGITTRRCYLEAIERLNRKTWDWEGIVGVHSRVRGCDGSDAVPDTWRAVPRHPEDSEEGD